MTGALFLFQCQKVQCYQNLTRDSVMATTVNMDVMIIQESVSVNMASR